MRTILAVFACLLLTQTATSQTPPETFCAGLGEFDAPFFIAEWADSGRLAIRLPEAMGGQMITSIRAFFAAPTEGGPVPEEKWLQKAAFAWGLSTGTSVTPTNSTGYAVQPSLKSNPDLRIGGWVETATEWPVLTGKTYWLVGYWQEDANFIRVGSNDRDPACTIAIGYNESGNQTWLEWTNSGLLVEVTYQLPNQGNPSGVFDYEEETSRGGFSGLRASITGNDLLVTIPWTSEPYQLQVVNVLGQTVVFRSGVTDIEEVRIPCSAGRPSGVYFCRVLLGERSYSVPVINLK